MSNQLHRGLRICWHRLVARGRVIYRILRAERLSVLVSLGLAFVLFYPDQTADIYIILAAKPSAPVVALALTLVSACLCLWYWARVLGMRDHRRILEQKTAGYCWALWLPRLCCLLPALCAVIGMGQAAYKLAAAPRLAVLAPVVAAQGLVLVPPASTSTSRSAASGPPVAPTLRTEDPPAGEQITLGANPLLYHLAVAQSRAVPADVLAVQAQTAARLWKLTVGAAAGVVLLLGFLLLRRGVLRKVDQKAMAEASIFKSLSPPAPRQYAWDRSTRVVLWATVGLAAVVVVLGWCRPSWTAYAGPLSIVCLSAAVWTALGSALIWLGKLHRIPVLTTLLLCACATSYFSCNDNHTIRYAPRPNPQPLPEYGAAFEQWLAHRPDRDQYDTYPVFIVAAEGGGIYAAYFTALVLANLQDASDHRFADHVFAISGVSGGSVGAACYAAARARDDEQRRQGLPPTSDVEILRNCLAHDLLSPLLAMTVFPDFVQRFLPGPVHSFDRALGLERALEEAWQDAAHTTFPDDFYSLWRNFPNGSTPALFLNTTDVETGERMVITNLDLAGEPRFNGVPTFARLVPQSTLPLSTAACLSARFPLVTPAGCISAYPDVLGRATRERRYADGGYFDNSGAVTLVEILSALRTGETLAAGEHSPFVPIVIRIGTPLRDPTQPPDASERVKYQSTCFGEMLSPVRAMLNTRGARSNIAVAQLRSAVEALNDRGVFADMIEFQLDTEPTRIPLGWLLSASSQKEIERQIGLPADLSCPHAHNRYSGQRVLTWLKPAKRS
jgi:hypothetical protein